MKHTHTPWRAAIRAGALTVAVAALLAAAGPAGAQEVDLGTAAGYSAFIFGDVAGLAKAEGRVAVGRNLSVTALEAGSALPAGTAEAPVLVVGRNVTAYGAGALWADAGHKGYGVYGSGLGGASAELDLRYQPGAVDFAADSAWLLTLSANLKDKPATGKVAATNETLTLTGTNAPLEVFTLLAAQVGSARTLVLSNVRPGAWLVLNVASDGAQRQTTLSFNHTVLQPYAGRVVFNFYDSDVLILPGGQAWGTLLAPYACVKANGGRVDGTVVAAAWTGATVLGNVPPVPGP